MKKVMMLVAVLGLSTAMFAQDAPTTKKVEKKHKTEKKDKKVVVKSETKGNKKVETKKVETTKTAVKEVKK